jgi:SAM-dependent methyltransferase
MVTHLAVPLVLLLLVCCEQLNDRLSLGQHRLWKRMAVKWTRAKPGQRALDVCCGSGDLALLLADAVGTAGSVTGLDFAAEMLQVTVGPAFVSVAEGVGGGGQCCGAGLWRGCNLLLKSDFVHCMCLEAA